MAVARGDTLLIDLAVNAPPDLPASETAARPTLAPEESLRSGPGWSRWPARSKVHWRYLRYRLSGFRKGRARMTMMELAPR
jgi:hypothetical protein